MSRPPREQWVCPKCGRRLHIPGQEHVCGHYDLEAHFERKDPVARELHAWLRARMEGLGPYDMLPMKTMIAFQARSNVAFIRTKRKGVELSLVLSPGTEHSLVAKGDPYTPTKGIYRFNLESMDQMDEALAALVDEAFQLGS